MKFTPGNPTSRARSGSGLDSTDLEILELLQTNCKQPLATIGAEVGLSAPAVVERIHKLEDSGVIQGYSALIDARCVGLDVTAFIGLSTDGASGIKEVEAEVLEVPEVLECHHVTGGHTLLLKVKTQNTSSLEALIDRVRSMAGVVRTETMVVLSSPIERTSVGLQVEGEPPPRPARRGSPRPRKRQARG
jgi:Lrp/AsnC family leucine-responsive transcriptional regulator